MLYLMDKLGYGAEIYSRLLDVTKQIYDGMKPGKRVQNSCERDASKLVNDFVAELNEYNDNQLKNYLSLLDSRNPELLEKWLLFPEKVPEDISIIDYVNIYQYVLQRIESEKDQEDDLSGLAMIAAKCFAQEEMEQFFKEQKMKISNKCVLAKINHVYEMLQEEWLSMKVSGIMV